MHPIQEIIAAHKSGRHTGIFSNCSANEYVLRAVMRRCKAKGIPALIEATANQVNQDGGYTGMTPEDFYAYCHKLAELEGFDKSKLILGGDHLGPLTWTNLDESDAMLKAERLIGDYVLAGFTKIHIDTSMRLASDDHTKPLSDAVIAARGARLCTAAEAAFDKRKKEVTGAIKPVYVIGSEVPTPGGIVSAEGAISVEGAVSAGGAISGKGIISAEGIISNEGAQKHEEMEVTSAANCLAAIIAFRKAFEEAGLADAWGRVAAFVVQPGVEFGEDDVYVYNSERASGLSRVIKNDRLVFEGHSTDYQPRPALRELVRDGIIILKVGPALTFALREALFALENIEKVVLHGRGAALSRFAEVLETVMLEKPGEWKKHYHGDEHKKRINRAYGFSDRARYYLPEPAVKEAIGRLVDNMSGPVALPLLSQFMPIQYARVRDGALKNTADDLILDRIGDCIDDYIFAIEGA